MGPPRRLTRARTGSPRARNHHGPRLDQAVLKNALTAAELVSRQFPGMRIAKKASKFAEECRRELATLQYFESKLESETQATGNEP